jgi:1,4-dihydroxy-2-naphthoate octaprenyltransferase
VSIIFAACIIANILASRAYSYRGIRLKKYPITGFLTVIIFQGAVTYFMVSYGSSAVTPEKIPWPGMAISSLLFGGFYPLTQIYQHRQDMKDGVITISSKLGITGTFIFSGIMYALAEGALLWYFNQRDQMIQFWLLQIFFAPVIVYFIYWWKEVIKDRINASFRYSLNMNLVAAVSTNMAFILLFFVNHHYI